jgi:hypothetical protein
MTSDSAAYVFAYYEYMLFFTLIFNLKTETNEKSLQLMISVHVHFSFPQSFTVSVTALLN